MTRCSECNEIIEDTKNDFKYHTDTGKRFHKKCYRKFYNRSLGRAVECNACKGSGLDNSKDDSEFNKETISNSICGACGGTGYVSKI